MAYAEVVSLMELVDEYLISFPRRLLHIEKERGESYHVAAKKFLGNPSSDLAMQRLEFLALTLTIDKNFEMAAREALLNGPDLTPRMLPDIQDTLLKIDGVNSSLLLAVVLDRPISAFTRFAHVFLSANKEFKRVITLFNQVATEAILLYDSVGILLQILKESSHDQVVNRIKFVADKASDSIVDFLTGHPFLLEKEDFMELSAMEIHPQKGVKNIFNLLQDIGQMMSHTLEEISSISRENEIHKAFSSRRISQLRTSEMDSQEDIVVGFNDELMRILEGLTGLPSGLEIVTIVGMGGIGKTTLAKQLFNHPYTVYHFYCRAWITISQVCQVRDLLLGLLSSVAQRIDKMTEKSNAQLAEHLYRSLKGKRYLIVLDDMWSMDVWNDLKRCFPNDKIGSRIIVTSRFTKLAKYVSPNKAPHLMNHLDTEKSWELLEKLVFGTASCSSELVEVGKQIAKRCGGLPLTIVVIAGILSRTTRTLDSWKPIAENVSSIMSSDPEQCLNILALSYIYLPHRLRDCFLYMGAFPEDCEIEAQKLINLWVAESFLHSDCSKNLEQIGEEYLEDLIGRNLVLVEKRHFGGKVKTCRLHDLIRELCLREAQKENFMNVVQRGGSRNFPAGMRNQRRLSFHSDSFSEFTAATTLPRVSTFLCFTLGSDIVPDILFYQLEFKLLRVLDMYFLRFEYFPEQVLKLIHLRYLALNVTFELPETICQLRNLQTFVIQGPWPSRESGGSPTLLLKYWSIPSLRHLHCSVASQLRNPSIDQKEFPGSLAPEHLQTLSTIRFSSCKKEVFAIMPCLKRLRICETKDEYSTDRSCFLLNSLIFLQELETLNCCFYVQNREPRRLSCFRAFPSTLRHLSLSWSYLPWEDMTPIAILPNLEVLKLKNYAFQGPKWVPAENGFRSLKHLLIEKTNLVSWEATVHQFPCLQNLILKFCEHLEEIPFDVEGIGSLHRIELHYCSEPIEILAKEIQEEIEGINVVIRSDRTPDSA